MKTIPFTILPPEQLVQLFLEERQRIGATKKPLTTATRPTSDSSIFPSLHVDHPPPPFLESAPEGPVPPSLLLPPSPRFSPPCPTILFTRNRRLITRIQTIAQLTNFSPLAIATFYTPSTLAILDRSSRWTVHPSKDLSLHKLLIHIITKWLILSHRNRSPRPIFYRAILLL
ncbi:hypothetical protein [Pajaroellobacter abortibovis]|uniref:hypothetical protein n=1 Tax=Pajaroellobacter abortibovis TaxID=1882918 RepID=UPI0012EC4E17|nr:hypothetical protein [Pajaroellobacter abortibovis]